MQTIEPFLQNGAWKNSTETAKLLLEHGAQIEPRGGNNRTALHYTAHGNSKETSKLLLKSGAEIEARDRTNETPLHDAAQCNS